MAAVARAASPADAAAELALARRPGLYVVVDPALKAVEIKIRGQAYVTLPLAEWGLFVYRRHGPQPAGDEISGTAPVAAADVALPATWIVAGEPASIRHRRVETIAALRPLDAGAAPAPAPAVPQPAAPPSAFELPLASGWALSVAPELPASRGLAAWRQRLADGWASLRGRPPERLPLLALALEADAARRLHHVLRPGTVILVRSPAAGD